MRAIRTRLSYARIRGAKEVAIAPNTSYIDAVFHRDDRTHHDATIFSTRSDRRNEFLRIE